MILIADSGSGKTDWILRSDKILIPFKSIGLNPNFLSDQQLKKHIVHTFKKVKRAEVKRIFFYGAGCGSRVNRIRINKILGVVFPNASISVQSDLLAAARSSFGRGKGIACILGTGANSGIYDGKLITRTVPSLGFIMGEEGSGNWIGRQLLKAFYERAMPARLSKKFKRTFNTDLPDVIEKIYRRERPTAYLASFAPFAIENRKDHFIRKILKEGSLLFADRYIRPLRHNTRSPIRFTGSIAYFLKDEVKNALGTIGYRNITFQRSPIPGLVQYHSKV